MGFGGFLNKSDKTPKATTTAAREMEQVKPLDLTSNPFEDSNQTSISSLPRPRSTGSPSSLSTHQAGPSRRQTLDAVKHQVMVNYLYQQQGNNGWRSGIEGQSQGILLRLSKDNYLTYPPQLAESALAESLKNLNIQVSTRIRGKVASINAFHRLQ
jgi:hypothetical protein